VQKSGYVREYAPEHPLADKLGLVMQHRRVVYDAGIELLCTKAGGGALFLNGEPLRLKEAKPLPSSD